MCTALNISALNGDNALLTEDGAGTFHVDAAGRGKHDRLPTAGCLLIDQLCTDYLGCLPAARLSDPPGLKDQIHGAAPVPLHCEPNLGQSSLFLPVLMSACTLLTPTLPGS